MLVRCCRSFQKLLKHAYKSYFKQHISYKITDFQGLTTVYQKNLQAHILQTGFWLTCTSNTA